MQQTTLDDDDDDDDTFRIRHTTFWSATVQGIKTAFNSDEHPNSTAAK